MPQIYVIYRPEDTRKTSQEILTALQTTYGATSVQSPNFEGHLDIYQLERDVQKTDYLLVVIGNYWADIIDESGQNLLNNVYDPVHMAIATAIKARKPIIPILIDGASMPVPRRLPRELRPFLSTEPIKLNKSVPIAKALNKALKERVNNSNFQLPAMFKQVTAQRPDKPQPRLRQPRHSRNARTLKLVAPILALVVILIGLLVLLIATDEPSPVYPPVAVVATDTPDMPDPFELTATQFVSEVVRKPITARNADRLVKVDTRSKSEETFDIFIFSMDQTIFAFVSQDLNEVQLVEVASSNVLVTLDTSPKQPRAVAFNQKETELQVIFEDGTIGVWQVGD